MKTRLFLILGLLPLLFSCENKKPASKMTTNDFPVVAHKATHNGLDLTVLDLSLVKDTYDISINSILSTFEVVQLENSEEALTADGSVAISDNYIGVNSYSSRYKLYNKKGEFICNVSGAGQGPDEYGLAVYDHVIDEANNRIYLLPYATKKLLIFDLAGNPQQHIPLPFLVHKGLIKIDNSKQELLIMALPFEDTPFVVWKQDFQGNVIQSINSGHFVIDPGDYSNEVYASWNTDQLDLSLFYWMPKIDSLYHYNESKNQLTPVFTAIYKDEVPKHTYIELPGYYILRLTVPASPTYTPRSPQILIDKKTLRGSFINWKYKSLGNIDGPNWFNFRRGYYTANMYPHVLKEQLKKALSKPDKLTPEIRERIRKLNNSITEDDNNIIIYGRIRNAE